MKNGKSVLEKKFNHVEMHEYIDSIEISDENVLMDWIFTSVVKQNVNKNQFKGLLECFAKDKDNKGIIHIPKQIGCFIAKK